MEKGLSLCNKGCNNNWCADPNLASDARWSLAWTALRTGAESDALPLLDKQANGPSDDVEVQRARYWGAIARSDSDDDAAKAEGATQLQALAREVPLSYYGMLACERAGDPPIERSFVHNYDVGRFTASQSIRDGVRAGSHGRGHSDD